jgi:hypothetical protein
MFGFDEGRGRLKEATEGVNRRKKNWAFPYLQKQGIFYK